MKKKLTKKLIIFLLSLNFILLIKPQILFSTEIPNFLFFTHPQVEDTNSFIRNQDTKERFLYLYSDKKQGFAATELKHTADKTKKMALIIYPSVDHNNAFSHKACKRTYEKVQKDFNLFLARPASVKQLKNAIYDFNKLYGPIDCLWIQGHGKKNSLKLNSRENLQFKNFTTSNFNLLHKEAKIFLDSCYTGMEDGLAQKLSTISDGRKIYAANHKSYCRLVDFIKGEIQFKNLERKNITVCYQNGINILLI